MISLIVESKKPVSRQLHGERGRKSLTAIASEQQGVAGVGADFVGMLPDVEQDARVDQSQINALSCQRMHGVGGVANNNQSVGDRIGNAHQR